MKINRTLLINLNDWDPIKSKDFNDHSDFHLDLKDEKKAQIIKKAHDLKAAIVEWHSHPSSSPAKFSISDLVGFNEFVPHVMWRLAGRPYSAIVVTPNDLDMLVWINSSTDPISPNYLQIGTREHYPSGLTLKDKKNSNE